MGSGFDEGTEGFCAVFGVGGVVRECVCGGVARAMFVSVCVCVCVCVGVCVVK